LPQFRQLREDPGLAVPHDGQYFCVPGPMEPAGGAMNPGAGGAEEGVVIASKVIGFPHSGQYFVPEGTDTPQDGHGRVGDGPTFLGRGGSRRARRIAVDSELTAVMTIRMKTMITPIKRYRTAEPRSERNGIETFPDPFPSLLPPFPFPFPPLLEVTESGCVGEFAALDVGEALSVTFRVTSKFPVWEGEHWKLLPPLFEVEVGPAPEHPPGSPIHKRW